MLSRTDRPITRFRRGFAVLGVVLLSTPFIPRPVFAVSNNYIISDGDLFNGSAMSAARVQQFLNAKGGYLAKYSANDGGQTKTAAQIIADVSREYSLSPKFFLVLLQKEQALITDTTPSSYQLDYALGYGCPSTCSASYRGFPTQLRSAAKRIQEAYVPGIRANGQYNGWGPGITKRTIDGVLVTPKNIATAVLYIYNPYVGKYGGGDPRWGANSLFQQLWNSWFGRVHPDGSLLRVKGEPGIWLIRNGKRSAFLSREAFTADYDAAKVIVIDRTELDNYEIGPSLRFPQPSLIQLKTGGVYLLVNSVKHPIGSKDVLRNLGYSPEEMIRGVQAGELEAYPTGATITSADVNPAGRLLQSKSTGGVVYVDADGIRHAIYSKDILRSQFRNQPLERVDDRVILGYPEGDPVLFRDGELIASKTTGRVYFISNGQRRPILDIEVFRALGFKTGNIIKTNDKSVNIHPIGERLTDVTL